MMKVSLRGALLYEKSGFRWLKRKDLANGVGTGGEERWVGRIR
jgi:hypothetical protein